MPADDETVTELLRRAADDGSARERLLAHHRGRLLQMVRVRLDPRLAARVDPSDVVQDVLLAASRQLNGYLQNRPLPFYPWLRRIAWQCLVELHRRHVKAAKRTVQREVTAGMILSDGSVLHLVERLPLTASSPSRQVIRRELRRRVRDALDRLPETEREVLIMRYLEQMSVGEIAAALEISEGAVSMRHLRALERMRILLEKDQPGGEP